MFLFNFLKRKRLKSGITRKSYYKRGSGKTGRVNRKRSFWKAFFSSALWIALFILTIIQQG